MKCTINNSQLTLSFLGRNGPGSGHGNGFRLQFYWPKVIVENHKRGEQHWSRTHKELFISAPTLLRLVWEDGYYGVGGELLGFGVAMDWQKQTLVEQ